MKKGYFILSILPIAAFCQEGMDDFFYVADFKDEVLINISYEEESFEEDLPNAYSILEMEEELDNQGLSLLEMDEMDETLLPWSTEGLGKEEFPAFIDKKAQEMVRAYDDAFAYDLPANTKSGRYEPSFEKIPGEKGRLVSPPKVVQSKPSVKKEMSPSVNASIREESEALSKFIEDGEIKAVPTPQRMKKSKANRSATEFTQRHRSTPSAKTEPNASFNPSIQKELKAPSKFIEDVETREIPTPKKMKKMKANRSSSEFVGRNHS